VFGLPSGAQERTGGRTESSKEFTLPDGTTAQILFTHPIHYQDGSGQWQDVDLGFHEDGKGGQIMDRHPSLRILAASIDSRYGTHSEGENSVTYHGRLIAVSTVSMDSDNGSQNQLICPCSAGGCGACEHEPVFLGSSTPAYTISRQQIPTCD
jgi:hypothetical protein